MSNEKPKVKRSKRKPRNVMQFLTRYVNDSRLQTGELDWEPVGEPEPTAALQGTSEKVEEMRKRIQRGEELWSPLDRAD